MPPETWYSGCLNGHLCFPCPGQRHRESNPVSFDVPAMFHLLHNNRQSPLDGIPKAIQNSQLVFGTMRMLAAASDQSKFLLDSTIYRATSFITVQSCLMWTCFVCNYWIVKSHCLYYHPVRLITVIACHDGVILGGDAIILDALISLQNLFNIWIWSGKWLRSTTMRSFFLASWELQ